MQGGHLIPLTQRIAHYPANRDGFLVYFLVFTRVVCGKYDALITLLLAVLVAHQRPSGWNYRKVPVMDFPIETQEQLDEIIKDRLERKADSVRKNEFGDYEELKTKAAKFDELEEQSKTQLEREIEARKQAEAKLAEREARDAITAAINQAADEYKVPRTLVKGATEEEIVEHAKQLAEALHAPEVPQLQHLGAGTDTAGLSKEHALAAAFEQALQ